ncbi:PREDICTED: uncharacterized protein LOC108362966 [Rhagoletis zephyria]|uniref:uncharacterized protein LOC108362966 n=1 Tax=Rhagoletis zephyria TaxID=28612 RepID=UPI0008114C89|nr:PREDICTED: uncharacterized protein LOC108362966 [Rhagoletis zephyria]
MRPYPGTQLLQSKTIFNYRLSRARRVIENSFGILTARCRILRKTIECSPDNSEKIVLGCLVLHNFIMLNDHQRWYCPDDFVDTDNADESSENGRWRLDHENSGGPLPSITSSRRNDYDCIPSQRCLSRLFTKSRGSSISNEQINF